MYNAKLVALFAVLLSLSRDANAKSGFGNENTPEFQAISQGFTTACASVTGLKGPFTNCGDIHGGFSSNILAATAACDKVTHAQKGIDSLTGVAGSDKAIEFLVQYAMIDKNTPDAKIDTPVCDTPLKVPSNINLKAIAPPANTKAAQGLGAVAQQVGAGGQTAATASKKVEAPAAAAPAAAPAAPAAPAAAPGAVSDAQRISFLNAHLADMSVNAIVPLTAPEMIPNNRKRSAAEGCAAVGTGFICHDLARNIRCVNGKVAENLFKPFDANHNLKACVGGFCGGGIKANACVGLAEQAVAGNNAGNEFFLAPPPP